MLRSVLLHAAGSPRLRGFVESAPLTRPVVRRFVAGAGAGDALAAVRALAASGRRATLDHLGEDTEDAEQAADTVRAYEHVLGLLAGEGLGERVEVSVKLSAVGRSLAADGEKIALEHARRLCAAAAAAGTTVTLDMEDHTTTDSTLDILRELRVDYPWVGAVLQAYLRRTEADCRELSGKDSRVRLCKGAYAEPASVAYQEKSDVDASYVRCLRVLMEGSGYPMVATHDPRMLAIARELAARNGRAPGGFEYQMLYGIRPGEQQAIVGRGDTVRVYVPYGEAWYGYFMRRLAERPANVAFFLRALATRH